MFKKKIINPFSRIADTYETYVIRNNFSTHYSPEDNKSTHRGRGIIDLIGRGLRICLKRKIKW